jgi:hypothetical protein
MSEDESNMLHSSLIWDQDGHLSDIAQNALVDAESALLPRDACAHAETCETCIRSIGQLAQLSLEIDGALKQMHAGYLPQRAAHSGIRHPARSLRHWPLTELGLALVIALLGQLPTLQALSPAAIRQGLKAVAQVSVQVLQHIAGTSFGAALPWIATGMLIVSSGAIAYAARRSLAHNLNSPLSSPPSRLR